LVRRRYPSKGASMSTLREAAQQALEALELALRCHGVMLLSDPPQDAWKYHGVEADANKAITALRDAIAEAEKQGPFGYFQYAPHFDAWVQNRDSNEGVAFYTAPPAAQRQWVGLTEQDFSAINQSCLTKLQAATSAESILKEKNT